MTCPLPAGLADGAAATLVRYARRAEDRLNGGLRILVRHAGQDLPTDAVSASCLSGPTGMGTSAARIGQGRSLQDVDFGCPWPLRVSPFLEPARVHALHWMVDFELTDDPAANAVLYRDWKLAEAAAYFYPDATLDGLCLAADLMGWYFAPFDDVFDGELGRDPAGAARLCGDLIAVLDSAGGPSSGPPVVRAFADLWRRSCQGMSDAWQQRARQHWKEYLAGQLGEVTARRHQRTPDAISCLARRVVTISSGPLADLFERTSGYELPDLAVYSPVLRELAQIVNEIVALTNDLVSAPKEEAEGATANNLLLVLEREESLTRPQTIERMRQMVHDRYARYVTLEPHAEDLDDALTPPERLAVRRFLTSLHDFAAGDNEWEHTSGRYATR